MPASVIKADIENREWLKEKTFSRMDATRKLEMNIDDIRRKIKAGKYFFSFTHTEKLRLRKISAEDVEEAISEGTIIEQYPEDPRGPSCLILGFTRRRRPIHILCGRLEEEELVIITAYEPDPAEWEDDWRTRRREV